MKRMLEVEDAQDAVLAEVSILGTETVALHDALGRVLREDVVATHALPPGDNSAMDGYAVRAADTPGRLRVIGDIPAGSVASTPVEPGTAMRIMTGALVPDGADAIAQVEITDGGLDVVDVQKAVAIGTSIRRCGEDMRAGAIVLRAGTPIRAAELAVLASAQKTSVVVGRRPTVAILSTGDELVDVGEPLGPGKIVNTNAWSLAALVREAGAIPRSLGIVRDTREATIAAFEEAAQSDFILSSGGVSVGAWDFVKEALDHLGAETKFWQVRMKPGKPVVLSKLRERVVFGLPGNPVSCMVSFHLFVFPSLRKSMGQTDSFFHATATARLLAPLRSASDRRVYYRVRVIARDGELLGEPKPSQGSGVLTSMVQANGLAIVHPGVDAAAGDAVRIVLIGPVDCE